jgi:choline dehydrogenase-like flavoprotein
MPRVITGNTMAPCIVIGERAAELLRTAHKLSRAGAYSNQTPFAQQTVPLSRGPQLATR